MPVTKKTAMQSELLKQASPELEKLEKKYKGKESEIIYWHCKRIYFMYYDKQI